jgi:hypothetical protein
LRSINKKTGEVNSIQPGGLYAPLPIPAYQVLARMGDHKAKDVLVCLVSHLGSNGTSSYSFNFGDADKYIKRIWTQAFHYENRTNSDLHLIFWHLPAEKRFGIRRIATKHLKNPELTWPVYRSEGWKKYVSQLGIRENSMIKIINDVSRSVFDRILFK